ncbi:MAG TPA: IS21 family transposase [Myxococcota bacterium]|nr:IS21 family transposase [Myxococcota bacterium]
MTIGVLHERGVSNRAIARQLGVHENAVRYRLARMASGARDGRSGRVRSVEPWAAAIAHWMRVSAERGLNLVALDAWLRAEHGYTGSYKAVQRFVRAKYPKPRLRVRRRVETPPGAQAQTDWAEFPRMRIAGQVVALHAFHLVLSHSRAEAVVWSESADQLGWLAVHNAGLRRLGGVPAVLRVDNVKTAVVRGAGPWGEINEAYRTYARSVGFHVDATRPRAPEEKGKVERRILGHRVGFDPSPADWESVDALQAWTDSEVEKSARRRTCPATGESVLASWEAERRCLAPLPILPEPFDLAVHRRVGIDATVRFDGRTYSVPFAYAHQEVEVHGCAAVVQIWADGRVIAEHPRRTSARIVLDPAHYEGSSTDRVLAPTPLGKMGRRLAEIAALAPEQRPISLYAALAEVAR